MDYVDMQTTAGNSRFASSLGQYQSIKFVCQPTAKCCQSLDALPENTNAILGCSKALGPINFFPFETL